MSKKRVLMSVKLEAEIYRLVKTAAAWRGEDIADYLGRIVGPVARRDCAKIGRAVSEGEGEESADA
jgi:hypothetical protein